MRPEFPESTSQVRCAAVLAGGFSNRMGREKALIEFEGLPLIKRAADLLSSVFDQVCVISASVEVAGAAGVPVIGDIYPHGGPISGIHCALAHFDAPTFIVACDMPFLNRSLIEYMAWRYNREVLVPEGPDGIEPLHAIYPVELQHRFEKILQSGEKIPSLRRILSEVESEVVPVGRVRQLDPTLRCFENWNTTAEVENAQKGF